MKFIFISGIFRSGTTLLYQLLNLNPEVKILYQPLFFLFKKIRELSYKEIYGINLKRESLMGINIPNNSSYNDFVNLLSTLHVSQKDLIEINNAIKKELKRNVKLNKNHIPREFPDYINNIKEGTFKRVFEQYLQSIDNYINHNHKKSYIYIGIKELFCEEFFLPLIEMFKENIKIFHIIRDPRAVVASRNYGKYQQITNKKYCIKTIIELWKNSYFFHKKIKDGNFSNYFFIKYEEIIDNLDSFLLKTRNFLKLKRLKIKDFSSINNNSSFSEMKNGIFKNSVYRWRKILTKKEKDLIEKSLYNEMKEIGYEITDKYNYTREV